MSYNFGKPRSPEEIGRSLREDLEAIRKKTNDALRNAISNDAIDQMNYGRSRGWYEFCRPQILIDDAMARHETNERHDGEKQSAFLRDLGKKSSGCYLTTACVGSMGLPDDCFELETLRRFRDRILMRDPSGRSAIKDYDTIAPEIIRAVNETEGGNAENVWRRLYSDIGRAVSLILSGDFNGAFQHYQQMTSRLKTNYLG